MACAATATLGELVARAGGALDDDWVPIAGGAPAGRLAAREATLAEAGAPSTVLVLPARHAWVRRLRTSVGDWLWRAASACEGCRACSDACPVRLDAHALVATLATGRELGTAALARGDGGGPGPVATFVACTGCGVCDAACPAGLSPRALAVDVRERLAWRRRRGAGRGGGAGGDRSRASDAAAGPGAVRPRAEARAVGGRASTSGGSGRARARPRRRPSAA